MAFNLLLDQCFLNNFSLKKTLHRFQCLTTDVMSIKTTSDVPEFSTTFPLFCDTVVLNPALVLRCVTITINFHLCGEEVVEAVALS